MNRCLCCLFAFSFLLFYHANSCRSEFGAVLVYFYICDRTNILGESTKVLFLQVHWSCVYLLSWFHRWQLCNEMLCLSIVMPILSYFILGLMFSGQNYNRDLFVFLYLLLIIVSAMTSLRKHTDKSTFTGKSTLYLNRHQTEEWKGWMQVRFSCWSF
jgi:hypothetical protein